MGVKRDKVVKIIKKTGKVFAWFFGILLLLAFAGYLVIRSPAGQTWLCQKAAAYLSDELKTKITIRGVDIEFFKKAVFEGIYVEDQHGDTLLYADKLKAEIKIFSFNDKYLSVDNIDLYDATIKLKKYKGEHGLSYRFMQKYFQGTDTTHSNNAPWKVEMGGIGLHHVTFAYIDTRYNDPARGMDYDDIRISDLNASFSNIDPLGDSLRVRIVDLKAKEKCGFDLSSFSALMTMADTFAKFDNLQITTRNGSDIQGFLGFTFASTDDVADDFIHLVKMDHHFSASIVEMADIAYFAPELKGMRKKLLLTGDVKGTVEHLRCKNIDLRFGERSQLAGNFSFNGLPDFEQTDMNFKIRNARTNKKDLEGIPVSPYKNGDHVELPSNIGMLGDMQFSGTIDGFLNDLVAKGKLNTAIGSLTLNNLALLDVADSALVKYNGEMSADNFNIGQFLDVPDMGSVSGTVNIQGAGFPSVADAINGKQDPVNADISGNITALNYHGYNYSGITVTDGKLKANSFEGTLVVNDPNIHLRFSGKADKLGSIPELDFKASLDSADLGALHFMDNDHEYILSTDMSIRLNGSNIDNVQGSILVNDLDYRKDGASYKFNTLNFFAGSTLSGRRIVLESDIASASIDGNYQLLKLPAAISEIMSIYLPAYFPIPVKKNKKDDAQQVFTWNLKFNKNTRPLQAIVPDLYITPNTIFSGKFDKRAEQVSASLVSDGINYQDVKYKNIVVSSGNSTNHSYFELAAAVARIQLNDTVGIDNFTTDLHAANNELIAKLNWSNSSKAKNDGTIISTIHFYDKNSIAMVINKSDIHVNDSLWTVSVGNTLRVDSNVVNFHNLLFRSGTQSIGFEGNVSPVPSDQLNITLENFNLSYLNYFTEVNDITLAGNVSGPTNLSDLYHTPIFTSNLDFHSLVVNKEKIGDGDVDAVWNQQKQAVYLHGRFSRGVPKDVDNILFDGFYYPKKKENSIDINATFTSMRLQILEPMMKDFCSMMNGNVDGDLHIGGEPSRILLNGKLDVDVRRISVDYLGLNIKAPKQPIYIEENSFFFDDFKISDGSSDTAKIYGHLFHENFKNFQFDMDFSFDHFLVLNTTEQQNEDYFGKVFATGYMNIFGYLDEKVRIDMSAKTDRIVTKGQTQYSEFNIPMTSTSEVGSNEFITFVDADKVDTLKKSGKLKNNGIELHLNVEANENLKVNVIFDKTVGDELSATGSGNIRMDVSPSGDFNIFGQYTVDKGDYLFTMKNVVFVKFKLAKGGVISWNGDPYEAQINADAVYQTTASVEPFFPMDSTNQAYHRSYPVDVVMHLDSSLMNPQVAFDINLPSADQNIQETVNSYIQTDLERNKQVLSLMVLNSFMTPSELRGGETGNPNYGNAGTTLLSNFVSGTLNNWLSQISTDFNMGVKYRPNDDMTTQELKVYLGTQLLNNRVIIDANAGKVNTAQTSTGTSSTSQWVGDVNVEYKVTDDGKVRLRAFNRSNDANVNTSAAYTQGVGVFYKEEFESWAELWQAYKEAMTRENPNRKKKDVPKQ